MQLGQETAAAAGVAEQGHQQAQLYHRVVAWPGAMALARAQEERACGRQAALGEEEGVTTGLGIRMRGKWPP
jgi:hypothetical protein